MFDEIWEGTAWELLRGSQIKKDGRSLVSCPDEGHGKTICPESGQRSVAKDCMEKPPVYWFDLPLGERGISERTDQWVVGVSIPYFLSFTYRVLRLISRTLAVFLLFHPHVSRVS